MVVIVMAATVSCSLSCSDNQGGAKQQKRMYLASGKFNQGYKEGKRDAEASLIDSNAAWMWLWMTEQDYQQGYQQGWNDGRQLKRMQPTRPSQPEEEKPQLQEKDQQSSRAAKPRGLKNKQTVTLGSRGSKQE
jgi:hypothetical protein